MLKINPCANIIKRLNIIYQKLVMLIYLHISKNILFIKQNGHFSLLLEKNLLYSLKEMINTRKTYSLIQVKITYDFREFLSVLGKFFRLGVFSCAKSDFSAGKQSLYPAFRKNGLSQFA